MMKVAGFKELRLAELANAPDGLTEGCGVLFPIASGTRVSAAQRPAAARWFCFTRLVTIRMHQADSVPTNLRTILPISLQSFITFLSQQNVFRPFGDVGGGL
jgi:hypothetical protein